MPGNSIGRVFIITTYGESHGTAVGVIVDGAPPGLSLSEQDIQQELDRRRPGQSTVTTPRFEKDRVEILSGVFEGKTTGTPISLFIRNENVDSSAYEHYRELFRPGHADFTYLKKYGRRDWRGSGRASGRETAARVAAGAVAKKALSELGIRICGYALEIASIRAETINLDAIEKNIVRCPDNSKVGRMIQKIEEARNNGDSVGGVVELLVTGCPPGLGDPVFDRLDAVLAHAVMSIAAVKSFEVGCGMNASRMRGSEYNDPFIIKNRRVRTETNNAGGILGGISTGEDILLRAAVRPPASISKLQKTVTVDGKTATIQVSGRHDPCIVPRIVPVVEAMVAVTILDCLLVQGMYKSYAPGQKKRS
jgi:chorismate synthase